VKEIADRFDTQEYRIDPENSDRSHLAKRQGDCTSATRRSTRFRAESVAFKPG
jgi:hypothetical protein